MTKDQIKLSDRVGLLALGTIALAGLVTIPIRPNNPDESEYGHRVSLSQQEYADYRTLATSMIRAAVKGDFKYLETA